MGSAHAFNLSALAPASLRDRAVRSRLTAPALTLFFRIADHWKLTAEQQATLLGEPARSTLYEWRRGHAGALSTDVLMRISYVVGIYGLLRRLFPHSPADVEEWVRRPNPGPLTQGRTVLDILLDGGIIALDRVRRFLEAEVGGDAGTAQLFGPLTSEPTRRAGRRSAPRRRPKS